jgi:hypothetical protein
MCPPTKQSVLQTATFTTLAILSSGISIAQYPHGIQPDLKPPSAINEAPAAGKRVRQFNDGYVGTGVYHLLYLPTDWQAGRKYPVIVEYAGNQFKNSPGTVEGSNLGYGISAGTGVIWVCMPYVNSKERRNEVRWWGDVEATVAYCRQTVQRVCTEYGGDSDNLFIAGFSRGAIACNYLGLHDEQIAQLWRGFICHSHYDGVRRWGYAGSDREAAAKRLTRLEDRPQFISHEQSINETRDYLAKALPHGNFTFQPLGGWPHTDTWVLYNIPERRALRKWFRDQLK